MAVRGMPPAPTDSGAIDPRMIVSHLAHVQSEIVARYYLGDEARRRDVATHRIATDHLGAAIRDLRDVIDDRLQSVFRDHVGATIRAVSPLVLDACRVEAMDLDRMVEVMRYDEDRRAWLGGPSSMWGLGLLPRRKPAFGMPTTFELLSQFRRCGVVVRGEDDPLGALGFRVGTSCLEVATATSGASMNSSNGRVYLMIDGPVPETLHVAARGRTVDDVVDHPLLSGRGYRIASIRSERAGRTLLVLRADPIPWRMPWARSVDSSRSPCQSQPRPNG